jgi:hypothetical protein
MQNPGSTVHGGILEDGDCLIVVAMDTLTEFIP